MTPPNGDSRSLDDLVPQVRAMAVALLHNCAAAGIPLTVTFTYRSAATQGLLYAQGRTIPGKIVTDARPGFSFHNYRLALDVVPTSLLVLVDWGDTPDHQDTTDALWDRVGTIGKSIGLRWGGDFTHIPDRPHFEWSGTLGLDDLLAGRMPNNIRQWKAAITTNHEG